MWLASLLLSLWAVAQEPVPSTVEQGVATLEGKLETEAEPYEIGQALMALARIDDPAAAEAIAERLDEFSGQLREAAIVALGNCLYDNRIDLLGEVIQKSKQLTDRLAATRAMIKHAAGRDWLVERFKKLKDDQVQAIVIGSLRGGKADEKLLASALKAKNPALKARALRKAAELNYGPGHKAAIKALGDANHTVKAAAASACGEFGGTDSFQALVKHASGAKAPQLRAGLRRGLQLADDEEEIAVLIKGLARARKAEDQALLALALLIAGKHEPALAGPAFAELLEEDDAGIRQIAIRGIEVTAHEAALEPLIALLEHEDVLVRADAVRALGSFRAIPDPHASRVLALAQSPEDSVRLNATSALRAVDPEKALPMLQVALQDENWAVQDAAVELLSDMRTIPAVRLLADHMADAEGLVKDETYQRLRLLTGQDFGPARGAWEAWMADQGDDYELPTEVEAREMLASLEARKAQNDQGYGKAEYHGLTVRPGGTLFILDVSGSMGFNYTPDARLFHNYFVDELCATIDALTGEHTFNIVTFNAGAMSWKKELVMADDATKEEAIRYLRDLKPWGGTNLGASLQNAFRMEGVQQVYLMTDGDPTVGMTLKSAIVDWVVEQNRTRRIRFHTIVAGDVDGNFLAEIAQLNRGTSVDLRPGYEGEEDEDAGE